MRRIIALLVALVVIIGFAPAITAPSIASEGAFRWVKVGGDPRCTTPFRSAVDAQRWFLDAKGQNDLARLGLSSADREEATVRVRNSGVAVVGLRRGNWVSWDGRTWEKGEIKNLTFGQAGTTIKGPIQFVWANVNQTRGFYPNGMYGWVPVAVSNCCNMVLIHRQPPVAVIPPSPPAPPVPPPPPLPPPPPVIMQPPVPSPITQGFPLYVEVRAKDAQRGLRPVVAVVGSGDVVNTTSSRSVRPLLDRAGNLAMFAGSVEFFVDYRSARVLLTDGSTTGLPDPRTLDAVSRGPLVGAGLYQSGPPSAECPAGSWQPVGQISPVRDDGSRLWFAVEMTASTRVIVELRTLPGQLGVVFHPFCRQPLP